MQMETLAPPKVTDSQIFQNRSVQEIVDTPTFDQYDEKAGLTQTHSQDPGNFAQSHVLNFSESSPNNDSTLLSIHKDLGTKFNGIKSQQAQHMLSYSYSQNSDTLVKRPKKKILKKE